MLEDGLFVELFRTKQIEVGETAKAKGWHDQPRSDGELIALCHSELSEALEALREGNQPDKALPEFTGAEIELADVVIRLMDMCYSKNWRLAEAVVAKAAYNKKRPHRHGGKKF